MFGQDHLPILNHLRINKLMLFGVLILAALISFELFNYSTTEFALLDLLGDLSFLGVRWATILAIAFCGIDFAGIARLFTPEKEDRSSLEAWYLLGAWLLAALMNAALTWWGVSIALVNHDAFKNILVEKETVLRYIPIFVAVLVWLIRVLIIGTMSTNGDRIFSGPLIQSNRFHVFQRANLNQSSWSSQSKQPNRQRPVPTFRPSPPSQYFDQEETELSYHSKDDQGNYSSGGQRTRKF